MRYFSESCNLFIYNESFKTGAKSIFWPIEKSVKFTCRLPIGNVSYYPLLYRH